MTKWIYLTLVLGLGSPSHALILDHCALKLAELGARAVLKESKVQNPIMKMIRAKIIKNPHYKLSADEQSYLQLQSQVTQNSTEALRQLPKIERWFRARLNSRAQISVKLETKAQEIFNHVLKNPNTSLSAEDLKHLAPYGFGVHAEILRDIARIEGPSLLSMKRLLKTRPLIMSALLLAGLLQPLFKEPELAHENYDPTLNEDEFEIVFESIHTWLMVRGNSYDYLHTEARKNRWHMPDSEATTRVRFKVSKAETQALKDFLDSEEGATGLYNGFPLVGTNCLSQLSRAVKKTTSLSIPGGPDRSPTQTLAYLKIKKALGDKRIEQIQFVKAAGQDERSYNKITILDSIASSFFFVDTLLWSQLDRTERGWTLHKAAPSR